MTPAELAAIRARAEAATEAYFDHLAPRCSYTSDGDGRHCWLPSGHPGPHMMWVHVKDGWRYVNAARQDVPRLCDEVARLTAEVERLSAMVPRWVFATPSLGDLMVGECRIGSVLQVGPLDWNAWVTDLNGAAWSYIGWEQTVEAACAAVCRRLGLPDIKPPENP